MADFRLNDSQRKAVEFPIDKPLKVIAGAGTGKTAVLTERFVHIVEKHHISPSRILALTFTKKAAAEMERRIVRKLLEKGFIKRSEAPLLLWVGNFHSICLALLRQYALLAGLDPSFQTVDDVSQQLLLANSVMDFLNQRFADSDADRFEDLMVDRIGTFTRNVSRVVNRLKAQYFETDNLRDTLASTLQAGYATVEQSLRAIAYDDSIRKSSRRKAERQLRGLSASRTHELLLADAVSVICAAYDRALRERDVLDFNDLIAHACKFAADEPSLRNRFDYILVDEFQDTDGAQYQLLERLSNNFKNVTVVCDKKQSIYEWREARIENIENFPGETIFLSENYRSFGEILDSANDFIARTMKEEKALIPALEGGRGRVGEPRVRLYRAENARIEADYVASEISGLLKEYRPEEIAILMRSLHASGPIEDALKGCEIPYTTIGGKGYYDLREAKDLVALVRLVDNPFDDLSMARVLKSSVVGLSDASLYELRRRCKGSTQGFYDALKRCDEFLPSIAPRNRERLNALQQTITELADRKWSLTLGETVSELLAGTNYLKYLACLEGSRGPRFANVSRFYKTATLYEEQNPGAGLEEFLSYVEMSIEGEGGPVAARQPVNAVQIMTVHQAKGLEFPVVFVMNLRQNAFPLRHRSDGFGYDEMFGFYAVRLPDGSPCSRYEVEIQKAIRIRQSCEENRVMYVAMTRAEEFLYLTTPQPEKEDDFFGAVEDFALAAGAPAVQIIESYEPFAASGASLTEPALRLPEEEIVRGATQAVARIRRSPEGARKGKDNTITLSYSQLSLFRHCPAKYALRYVYNLPLAAHEESRDETFRHTDAFTLGNLLHDTLMHFHRRQRLGEAGDPLQILESLSASIPRELLNSAKAMLGVYMRHPLSGRQTLCEEEEFHWRIAEDEFEIMFEGKIDRIHREGNTLKIVDYKTGERHPDSHTLQLAIYKLAIEEIFGVHNVRASNFYLSKGEEIDCDFSREELLTIRREIISDARRIVEGNFRLENERRSRNLECAACGYGAFCGEKCNGEDGQEDGDRVL